jgi:CrcB protein
VSAEAWIGVALLGSIGSIARFLLDGAVSRHGSSSFPFGTLAVNASGALVLGLLTGFALSGEALVLETHRLGEDGQSSGAAVNVIVSVIVGFGAALLGKWLGGVL